MAWGILLMVMDSRVYTSRFLSWAESVPSLLEASGLGAKLAGQQKILLKPNLVENLAPPITTPVGLVAAIIDFIQQVNPDLEIIVGEGCGARDYDTWHVFAEQGYLTMAEEKGIELLDLNDEEFQAIAINNSRRWDKVYLPKLLDDVFLLSVPVLKAHSLAGVTLTLKNMMGAAPPAQYQQGGNWRKASFHSDVHGSLVDINQARTPDFTIIDATIGMQQAHLWGPHCEPPKNMLAASSDPVALDAWGADILGFGWQSIDHIAWLDGVIGSSNYEVVAVNCRL